MALFVVFIEWPWLGLVPAVIFLALHRRSGRGVAAGAALAWVLYSLYEYGMHRRWLCSGECNIRVDLLLIYPLLAVLSIAAAVAGIRGLIRGDRPAS